MGLSKMSRAPGPKGSFLWGNLPQFSADPIGFLSSAAQTHGDVVRLRFGPYTAHLLNHPDHIEHVLSRNSTNYDKATRSAGCIAATTGESLLSGNETMWKRHRTLIQPAFQPSCFEGIEPTLDALLDPMLQRWERVAKIDIVSEMMQLVISAVIQILFTTKLDAREMDSLLDVVLADTWRRIQAPLDLSLLSSRLHRRRFLGARRV